MGCEEAPCLAEYFGSKAVVIKNNLALVWDGKQASVRPKSPDLRPSWSRTTLPPVWNVKKILVRPKLPDLGPSLSRIAFVGCEEAACPAQTSGSEAVKINDMSKSKAQPTIFYRSLSGCTPQNV